MSRPVPCTLCGGSRLPLKIAIFRTLALTIWACSHCDNVCIRANCGLCRNVDRQLRGL